MIIGIDASRAVQARRTGTENYSLQVIRQLLVIGGEHRFRLYSRLEPPQGLFDLPGAAGCAPYELRILPMPRLWTHLALSAEVVRDPPDVLFVPSHVLPVLHPRRSVVTVHDLGYRYFPNAHRRLDRWYLDISTRFNARAASHVLADSRATKQDLVRTYGVEPERISVVYLGRDEAITRLEDPQRVAAVTCALGIPGPYVLFVGTLQPRKNLERLVTAFQRLLHSRSGRPAELSLVLAGNRGWLSEGLFDLVDQLGLRERVIFPGFVDDGDLPALLSGAEVFAYPSLHEGFGLPVLEAQACGTPVLTANASSLPEVAGDGALLVDPWDVDAIAGGLERLIGDQGLRQRLIAAGYANVQRFSWRRCAEEILVVLERQAEV